MKVPTRTLHEPVVDQLGFVGGRVVEHKVDVEALVPADPDVHLVLDLQRSRLRTGLATHLSLLDRAA